jgi:hypothetical protein
MRRASFPGEQLGRRPASQLLLEIDVGERLIALVPDGEAGFLFLDVHGGGKRRRNAFFGSCCRVWHCVFADSDHNPRQRVFEGLPSDFDKGPSYWLAIRLYKVNYNGAISRPKDTGLDFENAGKGDRVANCPNAFRTVPTVRSQVLCSSEWASHQWLELFLQADAAITLRVKRSVEMIANVSVPAPISTRHHDEKFAFRRTSDPQR